MAEFKLEWQHLCDCELSGNGITLTVNVSEKTYIRSGGDTSGQITRAASRTVSDFRHLYLILSSDSM